jgi:alpha-amylase
MKPLMPAIPGKYERLGDAARAFAVLCCTWPGIPLVYSGQELPNFKRLKFFDKDQIDWTGQFALDSFYRELFSLRKRNPWLGITGEGSRTYRLNTDADDRVFAFGRESGAGQVQVFLNLSGNPLRVGLNDPRSAGRYKDLFAGQEIDLDQNRTIPLDAWNYRILEK